MVFTAIVVRISAEQAFETSASFGAGFARS
jgi:hypothetical protein